ncbi:formate dehydrogenase subunit delta [Paucibacter oligotrophus]|uniref:Formate dehydrogenase subunit delta n=1 Tax=Roseateles oligotrophus TaxID=1769250 RepID=A0A840L412_9BURK|nr:formate dehydrogenase subunit delta [Roseateles oligotrophus]MBB4842696.1 formate dehydrogenase subunit delta [Roseateles oligotrophus]
MKIHYLLDMANAIGENLQSLPDADEARLEISQHLRRFWDPAMRQQLLAHLDQTGGEGLLPVVQQALQLLRSGA